jgi:hypothetical protein
MDRLSPYIQAKLCEAILILLDDEISQTRLSNFAQYMVLLDLYKQEIPHNLLNELHAIMNDYIELGDEGNIKFRSNEFSDEQKTKLTERLLSIYIEIKGGNLIF